MKPHDLSPSHFLWWYISLAGSLVLRFTLLDFESGDFRTFYSRWYDTFQQHGGWGAFENMPPPSVYPPLYMYLLLLSTFLPLPKLYAIKLISLVADYLVAWLVWKIINRGFPASRRPWVAVTAVLFLPTVVMNGALWGQCDVMYTGCFLASLFYLLEKRPVAALIAFGLACSLKPQAIFWCPLLAGLFLRGCLPWKWIWVPGAVYVACGLPAVAAGWSFRGMLLQMLTYGAEGFSRLTFGATNWYQWVFEQQPDIFRMPGIVLTLVATGLMVAWMQEPPGKHLPRGEWLVSLALLSVLFPPFFLPGMHERYFFAADVLSVVYAVYVCHGIWVAVLIQFSSAFTYLPYLFEQEPIPRWLLPLPILAAMALVIRSLVVTRLERSEGHERV